ncbi:MAG: hypothetical protein ACR2QQ_14470, partial [Gammaproteobacteria bacterium]
MRTNLLFRILIPTVLALLAGSAYAQQGDDWDAVELRVEHVAGNIHMLIGRGGNIGLSIGDDGVIMIDDQFAPLSARIAETIRGVT